MSGTKFKETEIGMIPEDWEVKELGEVVTFQRGYDLPIKNVISGKYPVVKSNGINEFHNEFKIKGPGITIGRSGNLGKPVYIKKNFWPHNTTLFVKEFHQSHPKFIYYLLRIMNLKSFNSGSAVPSLNRNYIHPIKVSIPLIQEQKAIAKILSDLDSKIELLQKQNKTLEQIGQAIFKQWFVEFEFPNEEVKPYKSSGGKMIESELGEIPEGWRVGILSDVISKINDSIKAGEHLKDRKYVPIDQLPMKNMSFKSYKSYDEARSSLITFEKNDILVGAMRIYFHRVNISPFAGVTRTTTFVFRPKKTELLEYSLFLLYQDSTIEFANVRSKGSTMPYAVWTNSLEYMNIILPSEKVLKTFSEIMNPIVSRIRDSIFELEYLQKTRDLLLPKLMNGQIRVPLEVKE